MKVAVLGFGSWGTALALEFAKNGRRVLAYVRDEARLARLIESGRSDYLDTKIPPEISLTSRIEDCGAADIIVFAAGSVAMRELAVLFAPFYRDGQILVSASKGLEPGTKLRLSEVLSSVIFGTAKSAENAKIVALSGPCHAEELVRGQPAAYVSAGADPEAAKAVQDALMTRGFRIYTNSDIVGVELGGALKNCIAMAVGICDGMGYGDNTRAVLITRGIAEISRLGMALGASPETFAGLSGIGDLVVTCTSPHSRNRRAGFLVGQGMSVDKALEEVGMIVEAVNTVSPALEFARDCGVSMPITTELHKILFEGKSPEAALKTLMERERTSEGMLYGWM